MHRESWIISPKDGCINNGDCMDGIKDAFQLRVYTQVKSIYLRMMIISEVDI